MANGGLRAFLQQFIGSIRVIGLSVTIEAALYPWRKRLGCGLFKMSRRRVPSPWVQPGAVRSFDVKGNALTLNCEQADLRLTVLSPEVMCVRVRPDREFPSPFSYAVAYAEDAWPPCSCSVQETTNRIVLRTSTMAVEVNRDAARLRFLAPDGSVLDADAQPPSWSGERVAFSRVLPADAHVYGFGEKSLSLDKRSHRMELWNRDPIGYGPGDDPLYMSIPFYVMLNDGRASGLFFDNTYRAFVDVGAENPDVVRLEADGGELRYYFFCGPTVQDVLRQYTELTGRMSLPPLWALGYHQNRWSYYPDARVREVAVEFRKRQIPCDAIHLDIHYMDGYRCFTWDPRRFPDPPALVQHLHDAGFKVVGMVDPGIKTDQRYAVCRSGMEEGVFCKYPSSALFKGPVWPGLCYFPDFTSPRARRWWGEHYRALTDVGMDGFWNDMNEPVVFGSPTDTVADCVRVEWDGGGSDFREAHNVYGILMVKASSEGLRRLRPERRPLVISRSGWAGLQRYGSHWTGDNRSDWPSLRNVIPMVLTLGLSGMAFTGPDTGGFNGAPTPELLVRWNQLSAFTPFFRNHTAFWTPDQEPWVHGEPYESLNRAAIELRYRMLPYIYTTFWQCSQTGLPMMRPLFLSFPGDPATYDIEDAFMFGDSLLIAPVLEEGARSRDVYLPDARWYDFWSGQAYRGPTTVTVDAPLERIPLFVRAGSVVPNWPVMQYVGERSPEPLHLQVFPGNGESVLYEDQGEGWEHLDGLYRLNRFSLQSRGKELRLFWSREGRYAPNYTRVEVIIHGLPSPPRMIVDGTPTDAAWQEGMARATTRLFEIMEVEIAPSETGF